MPVCRCAKSEGTSSFFADFASLLWKSLVFQTLEIFLGATASRHQRCQIEMCTFPLKYGMLMGVENARLLLAFVTHHNLAFYITGCQGAGGHECVAPVRSIPGLQLSNRGESSHSLSLVIIMSLLVDFLPS